MSSRVIVPCEKGRWFCPSKSTTFDSTFPSTLSGLVSPSEYTASIARINASLERPKWTYRVQTAGRVLIMLGVLMLLTTGGAWYHMKHHHKHHHRHHRGNGTEPLPPSVPANLETPDGYVYTCTTEFSPVCGTDGMTYSNACEAMREGLEFEQGACTTESSAISPADENNDEEGEDQRDEREMDQVNDDESEDREDEDENKQVQVEEEESSMKKEHKNKKHHNKSGNKWGNKKHRKHAKRCIRRLFHSALFSLVLGFLLCRWMVMKKLHLLITRVVPAVCAEHHTYTSNARALPISWSLDEGSIFRYKCKNNKLVLVLDVGVSQPLSSVVFKGKTVSLPITHMASSAYVPLTTKEEA